MEILSDYEAGRLIALIEWVSRGGKPIADCASRYLSEEQKAALCRDLAEALVLAGEPNVSGYILTHYSADDFFEYGVFAHQWALDARIHLEQHKGPDWLQGLVFGYSSDAIRAFTTWQHEPESTLQLCDDRGTVEIVRQCSEQFPSHNHLHDRFQRSG